MGLDRLFDDKKIEKLNKLVRSLEHKDKKIINKTINAALNKENAEAVKTISETYISAAVSIAEKMLLGGDDIKKIMDYTGLTKNEVLQIQSRMGK